ncbi:MAG: FAD-dependent oxidoreductase [Porticoccaceae bacterium]|nr:FAD-dependent oxidoreductase [Porticoccaceae bacterium]
MKSGVVIIGAGQASAVAAATLRKEKYTGTIRILGDESQPAYDRPPLSKYYLAGEMELPKLLIRPEEFYADNDIDLHTNTTVASIDAEAKQVVTAADEVFDYDKLVIATGSRARRLNLPGSDLEGIFYLRTLDDVDLIRQAMGSGKRLCVIGGGYVGLEVAAVASVAGLDVTVIETQDRILQRVTTPEMSDYYHNLHVERGVNIMLNKAVTGFEGTGSVSKVLCGDDSVDADLVIIGVGIVPNIEIAENAGIDCDNGILVDDHGQTSNPDIYAAGDCTNHPNRLLGRRLRLESVPNAIEQARVACINLLGGDLEYASIPWFWSDQYELKLQMVGFSSDGEESVVRGDKSTNSFAVFHLKGGCVVAVDAVNSSKAFMLGKRLYGKSVDAALLADESIELKSFLS